MDDIDLNLARIWTVVRSLAPPTLTAPSAEPTLHSEPGPIATANYSRIDAPDRADPAADRSMPMPTADVQTYERSPEAEQRGPKATPQEAESRKVKETMATDAALSAQPIGRPIDAPIQPVEPRVPMQPEMQPETKNETFVGWILRKLGLR